MDNEPEIVELLQPHRNSIGRWTPIVGQETLALLDHLRIPLSSKISLRDEALRILSKCVPPTDPAPASETGLVVGYVQSGKTMSFTTVAALARDNGYQLIIVITGVSDPLFNQSTTRLQRDLRLDTRPDRKWQLFTNPNIRSTSYRSIEDTLADWQDPSVSKAECQTVLITVMKNHRHLDNLAQLLSQLNLKHSPVLVIDDEADQAGLNTLVREGEESTTYRHLTSLRRHLPHHTFLQYTATPQAPLLINIIDVLSPNFVEVLSAGPDYVGGKDFFIDNRVLVRRILPSEVPSKRNRLADPPPSLVNAMLLFFVGVAAGYALEDSQGNRSMMVHPSQKRQPHNLYFQWVTQIKDNWQEILSKGESEPDWHDLVKLFRAAYDDLHSTVPHLPQFEEIMRRLPRAIRRTTVIEVNSARGRTPLIDWRANYSYILVGGQAMDRGFTVEGLTVTYMPRHIGSGNADAIQQRARFLGYKRKYLGYCRIFLEDTTSDIYRAYVSHEEDIRDQLIEYSNLGKPLADWKRAFLLDRRLKPTRKNVLDLPYMQGNFSDSWCIHNAPHDSEEAIISNRATIQSFLDSTELYPDTSIKSRTVQTSHRVNDALPLQRVYEQLLTKLRITRPNDSQNFTGLFLQIRQYLENHPDETCTVFQMSFLDGVWHERRRALNRQDEVDELLQGANPSTGPNQGSIYPGDRRIGDRNRIIVQLHNLIVTRDGQVIANHIPTVAVWVPVRIGNSWLVQRQKDSSN